MTAQLKPVPPKADEIGSIHPNGYLVSTETLTQIGDGNVQEGRRHVRMLLADERPHEPAPGPVPFPANVSTASPAEVDGLIDLIEAHCRREAPKWAPVSRERIAEVLAVTVGDKSTGITGYIHAQGKIVGAVVLIPAKPLFCNQYYIHGAFHVVDPDHRRTRYAEDLLNFAKWVSDTWSSRYGYPVHLVYPVEARLKVREKIRFFRRRMYLAGATFVYPWVKD